MLSKKNLVISAGFVACLAGPTYAGTIIGSSATPASATIKPGAHVEVHYKFDIKYFNNETFGCGAKVTYSTGGAEYIQIKAPTASITRTQAYPAAGKYMVTVQGYAHDGLKPCLGSQTAVSTIQQFGVVSGVGMAPHMAQLPQGQNTPGGTVVVQQVPGTAMALPTIKSIKQVQYTDQGGETWIEASGTGNCSFTISGPVTASFSTTADKPFPIKVKIPNAPTGSHLWTAKGTGSCTGQATATFKVEP
jgi:hypothetical protein